MYEASLLTLNSFLLNALALPLLTLKKEMLTEDFFQLLVLIKQFVFDKAVKIKQKQTNLPVFVHAVTPVDLIQHQPRSRKVFSLCNIDHHSLLVSSRASLIRLALFT